MSHPYHIIRGVFDQAPKSEEEGGSLPMNPEAFGLTSRSANDCWENVKMYLNDQTDKKLIFVGRHGQGVHTLAQEKYGAERWQKEMCFQYGDDEMQWGPDPELTEKGKDQARQVGSIWKKELSRTPSIPEPTLFFCSPLRRAAQTLRLTFEGVLDIDEKVMIREKLREKLDAHTPDQRVNKSTFQKEFPTWKMEEGASEEDIWWSKDKVETFDEYKQRAGEIIDEIFQREDQCVSITAHEGIIQGLLSYIGHPVSQPSIGSTFAILVYKQLVESKGAF